MLTMLRLSDECEEVPEEVIKRVKKVAETAGKFLRPVRLFIVVADLPLMYPAPQRYDQFLFCVENKDFLRKIVTTAKSSSVCKPVVTSKNLLKVSQIPDFAFSLESNHGLANEPSTQPQGQLPTSQAPSLIVGFSPPQSPAQRPLRYDAYEAPPQPERHNSRSPTQHRSRSSLSARSSSQLSADSLSSDYMDPEMAKTMTAGELTLMPNEVRKLGFWNANLEVDRLVSLRPLE